MSFRNLFSTNMGGYNRLFSFRNEIRQSIDEIIIHPNQTNHDSSSSDVPTFDNFQIIENLVDFITTPYIKSLLKDSNKVLILKFETFCKPSSAALTEMSQICMANSVIILLAVDGRKQFHIYWKSKQIKYFLTFKIYERADFMNDIKLFEFLVDFLGCSLKRGHLGLHSKVPIKPAVNTIMIHLLADHRDYNLLLVAADMGDVHIVKLMLSLGFSSEFHEINAQTLAWKNRHFEVLSMLLKSNLIYPYSILIDECPNDIQEFFEVGRELNEAILLKDGGKVLNLLSQNSDMIHFYNLNNESALAFALNHRLFDMYRLLISKNIIFGPHERFSEIKEDMKESEREKLREIHYKESKFLPDNHMHVLLSNSRLGHDTSNAKMKYKVIQNAFEILNGNPFVQIILMIVAASRNFRIIFDFNRDSVEVVDPTVDETTDGLFYLSGRIYIGAKKLLDKDLKFEALGVLAHELCHFAFSLIYKNSAKPYFGNDSKTKQTFGEILKFCTENAGKERIVDVVHECYHHSSHHAELIVRVPHLIMKYLNKPERFNTVRAFYHKLFEIYENKIFKEMKEALPRIEAKAESEKEKNKKKIKRLRIVSIVVVILSLVLVVLGIYVTRLIFYKPIYKFSTLSREDQIRVVNAPVIYKHVDIFFHDLFPQNSMAYDLLTSDDISQMLDENPLDFTNPHLSYLNELIIFEWKNTTAKLKNKFLISNFTFQNETVNYKMMNFTNPAVFHSLKSQQIIDVLDGNSLIIHKMIKNETQFYTERSMFAEYIYQIYFLFMKELNGNKSQVDCIYKNRTGTASDSFENFYNSYANLDFDIIINKTNNIIRTDYYQRCSSSDFRIFDPKTRRIIDHLLDHKTLQKGFEEILTEHDLKSEINSSRIFLFSADAGTGKTETFRQFALRIKRLYPTRWVSYINFRQNKELYNIKVQNIDEARKTLGKILELNPDNQFEQKFFTELFFSGKLILLWDGYDQVSTDYSLSALNIMRLISNHTKTAQFVSTRPAYSHSLRKSFRIEPYTFVPLNDASKIDFLREFFVTQNISKLQIPNYIEKVQNIVDSTKSRDDFNTPLLLGMIAYVISNHPEIYINENLYQIYDKFFERKLKMWLDNINDGRKLIEYMLMSGISLPEFHQKYALRMIVDNTLRDFIRFSALKLKITSKTYSKSMNIEQISGMGILYINNRKSYTFAHSTFVEYFIAQYIIRNVFISKFEPSKEEAEMRIQIFFWSMRSSGISKFIKSYLQLKTSNNSTSFDPQILNLFQNKYKNFLVQMLQCPTAPIPNLMDFFRKDHNLLTHQLKINKNDGIYPSSFNYAKFNIFSYTALNRTAIKNTAKSYLTEIEYKKFISLKDQKGIILYTMYCIKQYQNSSEYARQSIPDYDLSDEIFDSNNVSEVLASIAKNLTSGELMKLLTSKTVWYMLNIYNETNGKTIQFRHNKLEFYKTLLDLIELNLSEDEQKKWFSKILKFPFLLEDEATRDFLVAKVKKLFNDSEIYRIFSSSNILHYTATIGNIATYFGRFNYSWTFFKSHTNWTHQKHILKRSVNITCYLNQMFAKLCYLVPSINLLQASLLENIGINGYNSSLSFQNMTKIYRTYFNVTELQNIILKSSKDFIPFLIIVRYPSDCKAYADFLRDLFKGNEDSLKTFLSEPVKPTKMNILDFFVEFYDSRGNFKIFKALLNNTNSSIDTWETNGST